MRDRFLTALASLRVLLTDGALGTMLQRAGVTGCPEEIALSRPEILRSIHAAYREAGADIHTTDTFGANRFKLASYGLSDRVAAICLAAVKACRDAVGEDLFVAGSIGPTGRLMAPYGELSFDQAFSVFREQANALAEAGADLILVETMSDLLEAKAALLAALDTGLPAFVNLTYDADGRTLSGTPPEVAAAVLTAAGAAGVGCNCSVGPRAMGKWIERLRSGGAKRIWAAPNAGMPLFDGETTRYEETPADFAAALRELVLAGASIVGGCCGSDPEHILAARAAIDQIGDLAEPSKITGSERSKTLISVLASRTKLLAFDGSPHPIGERINPTGKPRLLEALRSGDWAYVQRLAREQSEAGAELLDVNVSLTEGDEALRMEKAVQALTDFVDLPLVLDSSDPVALEAGLKAYPGKALVNSVSGERRKLEAVLPLVKRYGAAVLGLLLDERGIPETPEGRLEIAKRIRDKSREFGIPDADLFFDPLVLTAGADPRNPAVTLATLDALRTLGNHPTAMGLSNVSFGLPERALLNRAFLAAAVAHGLSAPILNPGDRELLRVLWASALLAGTGTALDKLTGEAKPVSDDPVLSALLAGDREGLWAIAMQRLGSSSAIEVVEQVLLPAMDAVGKRFRAGDLFLPQVLAAAEAMRDSLSRLEPFLPKTGFKRGTVVLATVEGDIHDIGKNIVASLLRTGGFEVLDLGKDVSPDRIADAARDADIVGLSALMTTTAPMIGTTVACLRERGLFLPVMVGGAVMNEELASKYGATAYSSDAVEALEIAIRLAKARE